MRLSRVIAVSVAGVLLTGLGVALLVLPGPGVPVLLLALAVFGIEFEWARRHRERLTRMVREVMTAKVESSVCWWCGARGVGTHECSPAREAA